MRPRPERFPAPRWPPARACRSRPAEAAAAGPARAAAPSSRRIAERVPAARPSAFPFPQEAADGEQHENSGGRAEQATENREQVPKRNRIHGAEMGLLSPNQLRLLLHSSRSAVQALRYPPVTYRRRMKTTGPSFAGRVHCPWRSGLAWRGPSVTPDTGGDRWLSSGWMTSGRSRGGDGSWPEPPPLSQAAKRLSASRLDHRGQDRRGHQGGHHGVRPSQARRRGRRSRRTS